MRHSAFNAAKACLALGCLSAFVMLLAPLPSASPLYVVAHHSRRAARDSLALLAHSATEPMPQIAGPSDNPRIAADDIATESARLSESEPASKSAPPHGTRLAATDAAPAPLVGVERETAASSNESSAAANPIVPGSPFDRPGTTVMLRVAEADVAGSLVPDPTPDPTSASSDPSLAQEVRALRAEIFRLAQAKSDPPVGTTVDVSAEVRRLLDQVRDAERFRTLEDEVRRLRSPSSPLVAVPATESTPTAAVGDTARPSASPAGPATLKALPSETGGDRFNLQVADADVRQILDLLGQMAGWNVVTAPGVEGLVTLNLRDVTLDEALDAVLTPRDLVAERKQNLLFVMPRASAVSRAAASRTVITKVYRPNYMAVKDLQALVTPILTPTIGRSAVTSPSAVGLQLQATSAGGDSLSQRDALVVQDYPEVLNQVDEVVLEMDVPPMQVVIEAYILRVKLDDTMRFGVNFALLSKNGKQLISSGSGASLAASVGFPTERGRLVPPLAQFVAPAAGLRYGFLSGNVTGFIEALEGISETSLVASPSLRVLNKQKAELVIGQRLGYKTQTFNNQQTIENVQFLDVGTKLILRPFAAPDGLVRMEIHPERSSGIIDPQGVPQVDTTEVTTNVMVRDGATVVIGGLIDEATQENVSQIPVLGSIPVVGNVFKNTTEELVRSELIVLITPRIVFDPVEAARGDVIKTEAEQRAAYFADKLSPLSRTNLARMHTQRATELFAKGRLYEAHDHAREALAIRKDDGDAQRLINRIEQALRVRRRHFFGFPAPGDPGSAQGPPLAVPPAPSGPASSEQTQSDFPDSFDPNSSVKLSPGRKLTPPNLPYPIPAAPSAEVNQDSGPSAMTGQSSSSTFAAPQTENELALPPVPVPEAQIPQEPISPKK